MLPLGSGVILDGVIRSLKDVPGLGRTVLVTNSPFAEDFRRWQRASGAAIEIVDDGTTSPETRLGAIRDLDLARKRLPAGDDLLVIGTDNLFEWSLGDFVRAAQRHRPHASNALWRAPSRESATQFGVVLRDPDERITTFAEKSPQPPSADVSLAVYHFPAAMHGRLQQFLAGGGNADAPGYFLQWLARQEPVYGIMMPGAWYDIGSLEAYQDVQRDWSKVASS
jgi:glucose-1-phosphate thymidylyltransferase